MISKNFVVLLVVALVSKSLHVQSAPAPAPEPAPILGYLAWSHGIASGLATGLGLYGFIDILTDDDNNIKNNQPIMLLMPQGGQPVSLSLRRNGNSQGRKDNQVQIVQLPTSIASTVQSLS